MGNAESFIEEFNKLDHYFEYLLGGMKASFIEKKNALINDKRFRYVILRYNNDIEVINRLRNVVAHENYLNGRPLADPREDIIEKTREVFAAVSRPMTVLERRSATSPVVFNSRESLKNALKYMAENDFSQVVIERSGKYSFLRREDTAKWLEGHLDEGSLSLEEVTVGDLATKCGFRKCHIPQDATVYEALAYFQEYDEGYPALMITPNGRENEKPVGILTPMDLIDFVSISEPSEY